MAELDDFTQADGNADGGNLDGGNAQEAPVGDGGQSEGEKKPFNLFESEEFRKYQAAQDRTFAQKLRETEARFQRQVEENERLLLSKMNEQEKREFTSRKSQSRQEELEREIAMLRQEQSAAEYREQIVAEIMAETGAPRSALDLSDPAAAWKSAYKWREQNASRSTEPKRRTDLGSGTTRSATRADEYRKKYQAAFKNKDALAMGAVYQEALREGINLQEQ